jgi:hypothetical protein
MNTAETASALLLWLLVVTLSGFVVMLYREVDLAYGKATRVSKPGLPNGADFPDIDVVEAVRGEETLKLGRLTGPAVVAVVSSTCDACRATVADMFESAREAEMIVLVAGSGRRFEEYESDPRASIRWISNPGDDVAHLKANVVPSLCALRDGVVVDGTTDGSSAGIAAMVKAASVAVGELAGDPVAVS